MIKNIFYNQNGEQICFSFHAETKGEFLWLEKNDICGDEEGSNDKEAIEALSQKVEKEFPDLKIKHNYFKAPKD